MSRKPLGIERVNPAKGKIRIGKDPSQPRTELKPMTPVDRFGAVLVLLEKKRRAALERSISGPWGSISGGGTGGGYNPGGPTGPGMPSGPTTGSGGGVSG